VTGSEWPEARNDQNQCFPRPCRALAPWTSLAICHDFLLKMASKQNQMTSVSHGRSYSSTVSRIEVSTVDCCPASLLLPLRIDSNPESWNLESMSTFVDLAFNQHVRFVRFERFRGCCRGEMEGQNNVRDCG
jgi:hypothetical protein